MTPASDGLTKRGNAAPVTSSSAPIKRRPHTRGIPGGSQTGAAALLLAPALLGFALFYIYPTVRGLGYALSDFNLMNDPSFVGLQNFRTVFTDAQVWDSMRITVIFAVANIAIQMGIGLLLAAFMQRMRARTWVRSLLLLPWLVPNVAIALIWGWLLDANVGYLHNLLTRIGLDNVSFYNADAALPIVVVISAWAGAGYTALLLYAGMLQVPDDLYEAAAIDGASETRMFFQITLPLIRPVMALVLVVSLIGSFQVFDLVQVGYGGNPIPEVRVIYYYIYQQAFAFFDMGYASAIALMLAVVLAALTFVQMRLMRADRSDLA